MSNEQGHDLGIIRTVAVNVHENFDQYHPTGGVDSNCTSCLHHTIVKKATRERVFLSPGPIRIDRLEVIPFKEREVRLGVGQRGVE